MGELQKKPKYADVKKKDIPRLREQFLCDSLSQTATNGYKPIYVFDASALIDLFYLRLMSTALKMAKGQSIITPLVVEETKRMIPTNNSQFTAVSPNCSRECRWRCDHTISLLDMVTKRPEFKQYEELALHVNYSVCSDKKIVDDVISKTDLQLLATALSIGLHASELGFPGYRPIVLTADEHIGLPLRTLSDPASRYYEHTSGKYRNVGVFDTAVFRNALQEQEREWRKYAK